MQNFSHPPLTGALKGDKDDEINGLGYQLPLRRHIGLLDERGQPNKGTTRIICVDRRDSAAGADVPGFQQIESLGTPDFTNAEPVQLQAESALNEPAEVDVAGGVQLAPIRKSYLKLKCILDRTNPLIRRDCVD